MLAVAQDPDAKNESEEKGGAVSSGDASCAPVPTDDECLTHPSWAPECSIHPPPISPIPSHLGGLELKSRTANRKFSQCVS